MAEKEEFIRRRRPVTFVDLFAGAGGFSEGFLQAYTESKYYRFVLASDINENCELTHRVRYNEQLGLDTKFITEDITSPSFLTKLREELAGIDVDVVTGGPCCQSFSLSGRRKRFDKRDGLFNHYLDVIRALRPKYFVMENVKGLLTKDKGRFKDEILREMRSIIDVNEVGSFLGFAERTLKRSLSSFLAESVILKLQIETTSDDKKANVFKNQLFDLIDSQLRKITRQIDYRTSKSDVYINSIRHGLFLLRHNERRNEISWAVIEEKTASNIDNDLFVDKFNEFIASISDDSITQNIIDSVDKVGDLKVVEKEAEEFKKAVRLYSFSLDECFDIIGDLSAKNGNSTEYDRIMQRLRLYNVEQMVLLSSDYGVPQNRERVVFIGSRSDQKVIKKIPATVNKADRVTVYEAISDLDFIRNGEVCTEYKEVKPNPTYDNLVRRRKVDGQLSDEYGSRTYAEWSKEGRLGHRFTFDSNPFYVKDKEDLQTRMNLEVSELFNHQTSSQNETVKRRLTVIGECGGYTEQCKTRLKELGLESNKRNYFVLKADGQSPTVVTMPDDFIHYSGYRAMTVREMARLQSFDDSFVFQGKRQTGGDKRKSEIPQYTLVGNAVPPLMSRAIGNEILKNIQ